MELISSDTNIWIDFECVNSLYVPFKLQYKYIISSDTFDAEVLSPAGLKARLLEFGLLPVTTSDDEDTLTDRFKKHFDLSMYNRIALAIAKSRKIILLTGDGHLRKAALKENVEVHGSLWIADEALHNEKISSKTYKQLLEALSAHPRIRLPKAEITKRLELLN